MLTIQKSDYNMNENNKIDEQNTQKKRPKPSLYCPSEDVSEQGLARSVEQAESTHEGYEEKGSQEKNNGKKQNNELLDKVLAKEENFVEAVAEAFEGQEGQHSSAEQVQPVSNGQVTTPPAGQNQATPGGQNQPAPPQKATSLFSPVEFLKHDIGSDELPFANEVDAALARRPKRSERLLSLAVSGGILFFIIWAAFASLDEVTRAEGQVISSQRTQVIQNLEGGILRNIAVVEGQVVEQGDLLAQLDNELAASSFRDTINKILDHTLTIIRLEAELADKKPDFPSPLEPWIAQVVGPENVAAALSHVQQSIRDQEVTFFARTQQKKAELSLLESQYQQKKHEVSELVARRQQLIASLKLATEQRNITRSLLQKRSASRVDYLNKEQQVVELQGQIASLNSSIPSAEAAAQETQQRRAFREAEIDTEIVNNINERRMEMASLNETLSAGGDRVTRTELRSPVRGTVKRIAITTLGGVVKPGESMMEIVPLDDTLLIEAKVLPSNVAFLRIGQRAIVKISAYDFSIYGGLEGVLEQISADTIEDKQGNVFYLAKIRTNETELAYHNQNLPIIPGMIATADILTGKKTVLDYLLKPILKAKELALREK